MGKIDREPRVYWILFVAFGLWLKPKRIDEKKNFSKTRAYHQIAWWWKPASSKLERAESISDLYRKCSFFVDRQESIEKRSKLGKSKF